MTDSRSRFYDIETVLITIFHGPGLDGSLPSHVGWMGKWVELAPTKSLRALLLTKSLTRNLDLDYRATVLHFWISFASIKRLMWRCYRIPLLNGSGESK